MRRAVRVLAAAATAAAPPPPMLVTAPIFYVNAAPHVGHLHTMVLADAYSRWHRIKGNTVVLTGGTDEHGGKIERAARDAGVDVLAHCTATSNRFRRLNEAFNINVDDFVRTTETRHIEAATTLWRTLENRGHIYKGTYEGWYSVSDEAFVPESQVVDGVHPRTGAPCKVAADSRQPLEYITEPNYMFRLSNFTKPLEAWLASRPDVILPVSRHAEVSEALKRGLPDLSISRQASQVRWGIPVPNDPAHTMYVWMDALANYLTVAGYPWSGESPSPLFPPAVQVVGKDIIKFHCIFWPAFLIAAGMEPPRRIVAHSHWTVHHKKMSKSLGNVVDPFELARMVPVDAVRYFLLRESTLSNDCDFSYESLQGRANGELADQLGNLFQRSSGSLCRDRRWPARPLVLEDGWKDQLARLAELESTVDAAYERFEFSVGINAVMDAVRETNRLFTAGAPWKDGTLPERADALVYLALETCRVAARLLEPVVPASAQQLLGRLNASTDRITGTDDPTAGRPLMPAAGPLITKIKAF